MPENISVVPVDTTSCQPFKLEVMVFSPEAGFKFEVSVERSCTKPTKPKTQTEVCKFVSDHLKRSEAQKELVKTVHLPYTAANALQAKNIQTTAANGVNAEQSDQLVNKLHPAVKKAENMEGLPAAEVEKR